MLLKPVEHIKKTNHLSIPQRGIVVDNNDPDKLGRVKVTIPNMLVGSNSVLPWMSPLNPYGLGGGSSVSSFSVPEIGTELVITFPYDSIYFGFYVGYWQSKLTHQSEFNDNYPHTYGKIDSTGTYWKVNKETLETEFYHASGVKITLDVDGNATMIVPEDRSVEVGEDDTETVGGTKNINVVGPVNLNCQDKVTITAASGIELDGGDSVNGAVQGDSVCAYTRQPHGHVSSTVTVSK